MSHSRLQVPFLKDMAAGFKATSARLQKRLAESPASLHASIVEDELRGLYHGVFVVLDGGSPLADEGLVQLVDEEGVSFDRFLHELCFDYWPKDSVS